MVHGKAVVIIFRVVRWPPAAGADWAKIPKGAAVTQIKPPSPVGGHKIWICGTKKREKIKQQHRKWLNLLALRCFNCDLKQGKDGLTSPHSQIGPIGLLCHPQG